MSWRVRFYITIISSALSDPSIETYMSSFPAEALTPLISRMLAVTSIIKLLSLLQGSSYEKDCRFGQFYEEPFR